MFSCFCSILSFDCCLVASGDGSFNWLAALSFAACAAALLASSMAFLSASIFLSSSCKRCSFDTGCTALLSKLGFNGIVEDAEAGAATSARPRAAASEQGRDHRKLFFYMTFTILSVS